METIKKFFKIGHDMWFAVLRNSSVSWKWRQKVRWLKCLIKMFSEPVQQKSDKSHQKKNIEH